MEPLLTWISLCRHGWLQTHSHHLPCLEIKSIDPPAQLPSRDSRPDQLGVRRRQHHWDTAYFPPWQKEYIGTVSSHSAGSSRSETHPIRLPCRRTSEAAALPGSPCSHTRQALFPGHITDAPPSSSDCRLPSPGTWSLNVLCISFVQCPGYWIGTQLRQITLFILHTWRYSLLNSVCKCLWIICKFVFSAKMLAFFFWWDCESESRRKNTLLASVPPSPSVKVLARGNVAKPWENYRLQWNTFKPIMSISKHCSVILNRCATNKMGFTQLPCQSGILFLTLWKLIFFLVSLNFRVLTYHPDEPHRSFKEIKTSLQIFQKWSL